MARTQSQISSAGGGSSSRHQSQSKQQNQKKKCTDPTITRSARQDSSCLERGDKLVVLSRRDPSLDAIFPYDDIVVDGIPITRQYYLNEDVRVAYWKILRSLGIQVHPNRLRPPEHSGDVVNGFFYGYNVIAIIEYIFIKVRDDWINEKRTEHILGHVRDTTKSEQYRVNKIRKLCQGIINQSKPSMSLKEAVGLVASVADRIWNELSDQIDPSLPCMRNIQMGRSLRAYLK